MQEYLLHLPHEIEDLLRDTEDRSAASGDQDRAEKLLAIPDDTYRKIIPERLPLSSDHYMIQECPACGRKGADWFRLSSGDDLLDQFAKGRDENGVLTLPELECVSCRSRFPNPDFPEDDCETIAGQPYPFHRTAKGERYYFSICAEHLRFRVLGYRNIFYPLSIGFLRTARPEFAQKAVMLLSLFAERFEHWPLFDMGSPLLHPDMRDKRPRVRDTSMLGASYGGWYGYWGGSYMATEWGLGFDLIKDSPAVTPEIFARIRDGAVKPLLEHHALPIMLYIFDKFHNSTTNHYRALAACLRVFGKGLVLEDVVRHSLKLDGGDIAQYLLWSPKGMRCYCDNCFDACGLYAERTTGYQSYASMGNLTAAKYLRGYSDPPDYKPGPDVAAFYRPINDFAGEKELPAMTKAVRTTLSVCHADGMFYVIGDAGEHGMAHPAPVRNTAMLCPDEKILSWEKSLVERGQLEDRKELANVTASPFPPHEDILSQDYGLAVIRLPEESNATLGIGWTPYGDYHSHYDGLHITYRAKSRFLFADPPTRYTSPLRFRWTDRTLAHATVSKDNTRQEESRGGELLDYHRASPLAEISVRQPDVYPELSEYRRDLLIVTGNGEPYVVDMFTVEGKGLFTQSWPAESDILNLAGVDLEPEPEDTPGFLGEILAIPDDKAATRNGEDMLRDIASSVIGNQQLVCAEWDIEDAVGEVHIFVREKDRIVSAEYPRSICPPEPLAGRMLAIERKSTGRTCFLSVFRVRDGSDQPLEVTSLDVENGTGLKITGPHGADTVIFGNGAECRCGEAELTFNGNHVMLRHVNGVLSSVRASGGSVLRVGDRDLAPENDQVELRVVSLDFKALTLDAEVLSGAPEKLPGRGIFFKHANGRTSWLTPNGIRSIGNNMIRLSFDGEKDRFQLQSGLVSEIPGPDRMATLTIFPEDVPEGAHLHVDRSNAMIVKLERTGTPLVIDGTTTNDIPRRVIMDLDQPILNESALNMDFFISNFAPGSQGTACSRFAWNADYA